MENCFYTGTMYQRQNGIPVIGRNESSQPCGSDLARPEFGEATFLNVSGAIRMKSFAPQAPKRHT
jgi:hypothetical protein